MTTYLTNRDGGKTNEEGHVRFMSKVWQGNVVSGLQASQQSPLAMAVNISIGDAKVDYSNYAYTVWTDAIESVGIATADPSNPRISRIVGYVDRGVTPSSANTNNPGLLKFKEVAGTPAASPTRPSDVTVQASVGASNPFFDVADVLVGTGVTTIDNSKITDKRVIVSVPDGTITPSKLATGAASSSVATSEATTSTSYVDLATVQSVTVTIGQNGLALLSLYAWVTNTTAGGYTVFMYTGVDISGANTAAATDSLAGFGSIIQTGGFTSFSLSTVLTGLNPGVTTFKLKFRTSSGNAQFSNRRISVIPL